MYVCICKAVSDRAIRRAVANDGVVTLRELSRRHGVGTCCGKCVPEIREMLAQVRSTETVPPVRVGSARLNASVAA
ncbi:(2Fe-2S)-binding protein [Sinimarinibacterium sp. CAU 1509]|uniref:(2Fe-2S)-binding protein n=1 Tax=Sinimarinibacterium sp. CAU 1509 TaxID=2562283 RepID=UPI0010AC0C73|nr:(2Fe-2S)-binding protein [Sinimarinibacterium sp. CAU 1509]TJY64854.1 (2Fe-2S)-binding protein [Sinimarinibacterium sp. CAU 1509]